MEVIWQNGTLFRQADYENEAALEKAISQIQGELFGEDRLYFSIKKKIGLPGGQQNIPDGYLLDLSGSKPRLYVIEAELAAHDPLRHIAVQILQFSLAFEEHPRAVKAVLLDAIRANAKTFSQCNEYALANSFRGIDHMLESLVFENAFAALVIIDSIPSKLQRVLDEKFKFSVEVIEVARYVRPDGTDVYRFEPFLADVRYGEPLQQASSAPIEASSIVDVDTIVVPAREDGFQETFLGENRWYEIRIHATMRPQIKYIAVYRTAPISAITHIAPVKSIEPWEESGKYVVNFSEPAKEIPPIKLVPSGVRPLQNIRYTQRERLMNAKTLDDLWGAQKS